MEKIRILVNRDLCEGHGQCAATAPTIFEVTEDDQVRIRDDDPPDAMYPLIDGAARNCPKAALSVLWA